MYYVIDSQYFAIIFKTNLQTNYNLITKNIMYHCVISVSVSWSILISEFVGNDSANANF